MQDLFNISGKVALVTGGSRGIGEMIATGFVHAGVRTYISSRNADECGETAKRLSEHGECIAIAADLSTTKGIDTLVKALTANEDKLDIHVNNAGETWGHPNDDFPESGRDKIMDVIRKALVFLTHALLEQLTRADGHEVLARVINISLIHGSHVRIKDCRS